MIVLTPDQYPQGSENWLRARVGVCTASRFTDARNRVSGLTDQQAAYVQALQAGQSEAAAMAAAGYKKAPTAGSVARALRGERVDKPGAAAISYAWLIAMETIAREPLDETFVTYAMRRGRDLEPQARAVYEARTKAWVEEVSLVMTDDARFGYSADGFRDDDGLVEIKCPMSCEKLGNVWADPDTAHLEYIDQINGGLWITGRKYCDLVIYCPWLASVGKDLFVKRIHRDEAAIEALEADLVEFMRMVDANVEVLRRPTKMTGRPKDEGEAPAEAAPTPPAPAPKTPAPAAAPAAAIEPTF